MINCDGCTKCCRRPGFQCAWLGPDGCTVYEDRPDECVRLECVMLRALSEEDLLDLIRLGLGHVIAEAFNDRHKVD